MALALLVTGCAAAPPPAALQPPSPEPGVDTPDTAARFQAAVALFTSHDRARDWNEASCKATVAALLDAGVRGSVAPTYDAALVEQRCGKLDDARSLLEKALRANPDVPPGAGHARDRHGDEARRPGRGNP